MLGALLTAGRETATAPRTPEASSSLPGAITETTVWATCGQPVEGRGTPVPVRRTAMANPERPCVLKGRRRQRRGQDLAKSFWFVAAGLAGVICAALLVFKL